ncbi:hypothetical protein JCGZ_09031 [Jatropha curcas]|uniref:Uncharacterized protein n=1 Tax=Jatropha curcas TaxID=180498 RepID=A0A067KKR3_JATCU|nr:uncharacterized protein LOC105636262 [Jatropha curcas]KDP35593.1 hypothetical protein JCGZ_09031 [Jatropha curcas]
MDMISGRPVGSGVLVDEIESKFSNFVRVEDVQETFVSDGDDNSDAEEGCEELEPYGPELVSKRPENCAADEDNEPETALELLFSEQSVQISLPLVSAMKGSREKLGASPRKLTVSWAPDVYDPIPNSLSHTVKGKQKKSRRDKDKDNNNNYKKNGKKGQKGNSRGGAGGKDKKQLRKAGGRSNKGYKTLNTCDGMVDSSDELGEFDVGSPDYCGSSFLKNSPTKFHYSVAEAL